MADQLNMNGLSLGTTAEQRSYIPPHLRNMKTSAAAPVPPMNGSAPMPAGMNGSAWAAPAA